MSAQRSMHTGRLAATGDFVMKNRTCDRWVLETNRMKETSDPKLARRFGAEWLNGTCWDWEYFYIPVSAKAHAKEQEAA